MPELDQSELNRVLVAPGGLWQEITVVTGTGSTNADLLAQARSGAPEGLVLAAETQRAGRGRMGRRWVSAPHAALTFSVLLRPRDVAAGRLGWVPLLAGVATAAAVRDAASVDARLKWPNDVLVGGRKLAGILAESSGDAVVVGIGVNVSQQRAQLPVPAATSLTLETAGQEPAGTTGRCGRAHLLAGILAGLARWYLAWRDQADPGDARACGLHREYLRWSATLGRNVTVMVPGGRSLAGVATGVDPSGRLELRTAAGVVPVGAGDVVHLR